MLLFQWFEGHAHFLTSQKHCFYSVWLQESHCHCRILTQLPIKPVRGSQKCASVHRFCGWTVFLANISSRALLAIVVVASDRTSERRNIDYFVGFIDGCDVDAKLSISWTCRRVRERDGDGVLVQIWWFLYSFIDKVWHDCVGMMHFWEGFAHLDLRFPMFLGFRTLWYAFL